MDEFKDVLMVLFGFITICFVAMVFFAVPAMMTGVFGAIAWKTFLYFN